MRRIFLALLFLPLITFALTPASASEPKKPELLEAKKIWDKAPHNAFTDLIRHKGRWYCVFREGKGHVSPDGALRVITSKDGKKWESAALITSDKADLRDAKITVTPKGKLMLSGAGALHQPSKHRHQSMVWFSEDGRNWSDPVEIGDPDFWVWRITWHKGTAYGIGYATAGERMIRLYKSEDGRNFDILVENLFDEGYPNETSMVFQEDDTCLCLLRRDGNPSSAQLGKSQPPYTDWTWNSLETRIGGPHMIQLPDDRFVAAGRHYPGGAKTRLWWLKPEENSLEDILTLPSGGDTSYPGLVWHEDVLWMSYYASHEGKTSIYLARIKLPSKD